MFITCSEADVNDLYKVLIGCIVPRPIAWVSTRSKAGVDNLAPFSFFNCFGVDPPMVGFAPGWKSIEQSATGTVRIPKDTMANIAETNQFVVNLVSHSIAEQMNATSAPWPLDVSEFTKANLTAIPSQLVTPRAVQESLVSLECKLIEIFQHGNNNLVLGEVIGIRLDPSVITDRLHIRPEVLDAVGRMAGTTYTRTRDRFDLARPSAE
jgi:flavin reductase (DIM6/NTAB) family NADH-FMN oxidoreductase RutF